MSEQQQFEAPCPAPIRAFGCRRITLDMRAWTDRADQFKGLPRGTTKPCTFLFAFQEAEPYLGLPAHSYKLVSYLVGLTQPQDWEEGSRPIAWPSLERQAEFLGLSTRRVQKLNRVLGEAGIFVMRDNPQGRRYGHRDKQGRITEAYGFDLSLLAERFTEFKAIAAEAQVERNRMKKLRRRSTLARKATAQAAEELDRQGQDSDRLRQLLQETAELVKAAGQCRQSDELELAVEALERRRDEARQMLRALIKPVERTPLGELEDTHSTSTTLPDNDLNHTVIASEDSSRAEAGPAPQDPSPPPPQQQLFPETLKITPVQLVELAPRLAPYMPARFNDMSWAAIVEAALWLSGEMKLNRTLWARACQLMGREYAAVALAIVSTWPEAHFTSGPAGYFAGMLRKFEKGELHLARTLWKLKDQTWGSDRQRKERRV
jgi:replication initiation protein RepC